MQIFNFYKGISWKGIVALLVAAIFFIITIACEAMISSESTVAGELLHFQANKTFQYITNPWLQFYINNLVLVWYSIFILFILGSFRSFVRSFDGTTLLVTQLALASTVAISFLCVSIFFISRLPNVNAGYYTITVGVFSVMSVCIGWLINTQVTRKYEEDKSNSGKRNYKRTHTINILLKINLSQDFQQHIEKIATIYSITNGPIPEDDVRLFFPSGCKAEEAPLSKEKSEAIRSVLFVLDLYEFICEGIEQGDIDEEVMYESFFGSMYRAYKRAINLINAYRYGKHGIPATPKAFIRLISYINKHRSQYEQENIAMLHDLTKTSEAP